MRFCDLAHIFHKYRTDKKEDAAMCVLKLTDAILEDTALESLGHNGKEVNKDGLTLISDNPDYPPIRAHGDTYDYIAIYGVPVGYTRIYKADTKKKIKKGC